MFFVFLVIFVSIHPGRSRPSRQCQHRIARQHLVWLASHHRL